MTRSLRIATRRSALALAQAHEVRGRLVAALGLAESDIALVPLVTTGDRNTSAPLSAIGGKGLFTKEIDEALLRGEADLAVHSMKDMPSELPEGLALAACLPREDPRDAFLSAKAARLSELPEGAVVGTSALRRRAQILAVRPDLRIAPLRGNVDTRLRKLAEGEIDAAVLALAGLRRLGREGEARDIVEPDLILPAIGQGIIALVARADDARTRAAAAALDHGPSAAEAAAERAFLADLGGSCRTPIAGLARANGGRVAFRGAVFAPDGSARFAAAGEGPAGEAAAIGRAAAQALMAEAGADILVRFAAPG